MAKREVFTDDKAELEVHSGEAGSIDISMKWVDMEAPILLSLGKEDVDELIKTLTDLANDIPSIVSIR